MHISPWAHSRTENLTGIIASFPSVRFNRIQTKSSALNYSFSSFFLGLPHRDGSEQGGLVPDGCLHPPRQLRRVLLHLLCGPAQWHPQRRTHSIHHFLQMKQQGKRIKNSQEDIKLIRMIFDDWPMETNTKKDNRERSIFFSWFREKCWKPMFFLVLWYSSLHWIGKQFVNRITNLSCVFLPQW